MKMMRVFVLFVVASVSSNAQYITLSTDTVDLGVVFENQSDSTLVYIKNDNPAPRIFTIAFQRPFPFYGDTVVSIHYQNQIVGQGDSLPVWVVAKPEHNVVHKGSILVSDDNGGGEVIIPYTFQGRYSKSYYNATENKSEGALRTQLKTTTGAGYTQLSYNAARDEMYADLDNVNGDVECVYTGRTATFNTRAGANANSFNCEHTFPQGFFSQNLPMRSDIHHLFSTDVNANSQRGSLPFGVVSNPTWQQGGSKKNSTTFEPRDAQKGATARAMMYFVTRYQDYSNHFSVQETILRQWHTQFPPSQSERNRNDGIFQLQNNRNPFVDYPQFAERITNLVGPTSAPDKPNLYVVDTVLLPYDSTISSSWLYRLYAVNYGNTAVSVNNFQFSAPTMQFANNTGGDTTLPNRHALALTFNYNPGIDYSGETLTFLADLSNPTTQTIYFKRGPVPAVGIEELRKNLQLHIGKEEISWQLNNSDGELVLYDAMGRHLQAAKLNERRLPIGNLKLGMYIIHVQTEQGYFSQKFVIAR